MRAMLAALALDGVAQTAIGVGAFALLLMGVANVPASAAEARGILWGLLGLVLAAMATTPEVITEEAHWYEYEGTFRGMVG